MKVVQELTTNSSASVAVHSAYLSHAKHDLNGSEMAVQTALVARSSRSKISVGTNFSSADEELDAVVSAKFFGDVVSAGMKIGSAIGNAAIVVGNHVVEVAETTYESLPDDIQDAASSIGNVAVGAMNAAVDVGEMVAATSVHLAGTALDHATRSLEEGAKLSSKVGKFIADKAAALGGEIQKLGPLAAGLASAAWEQIKKFVSCLSDSLSLCSVLIGDQCDCEGGSHVEVSTDKFSVRCVFEKTADFSKGFGVRAVPKNDMNGKTSEGIGLKGTIDTHSWWHQP